MKSIFLVLSIVAVALCCDNYKVTATSLNLRTGAGTGYAISGSASNGQILCVDSITNGWAKLSTGKYASASYLTKVATTPAPTSCVNYTVNASSLNLRTGPGTTYAASGTASNGQTLCVVSITNGWAKLNTGKYASAQYLTKQGTTPTPTPTPSGSSTITAAQVKSLFPRVTDAQSTSYASYLNAAFKESQINTKLRICHFLAQIGHESGGLYYWEEIASGAAYEGRKDLGNTQPGDGVKYKGRGPIQITGRYNYNACGKYLGVDLINNPTLLAKPEYGFRGAAWFWITTSLNTWADKDDILTITKKVNGGTNGLADRQSWLAKAKKLYGI